MRAAVAGSPTRRRGHRERLRPVLHARESRGRSEPAPAHVPPRPGELPQVRARVRTSDIGPEGTLVMLTPNTASWGHSHFGNDWRSLEPPRHLHLFNPSNMRRLLDSAELTPARIATLAINASAVWPASMAIRSARSSRHDL